MSKVILDEATRARLDGKGNPLEVCDEQGRTVAVVLPPDLYREMIRAWAKELFKDEDLERARAEYREQGGYTTEEVLARLHEFIEQAKGRS